MMKSKILVVVDMQKDFVTGSLANKDAEKIVPGIVKKIEDYKEKGYPIVCTLDSHTQGYLETQEGENLPVEHCIFQSDGWRLVEEIETAIKGYPRLKDHVKNTFGSMALPQTVLEFLKVGVPAEIEICGTCTDICVISNALILKAAFPEVKVSVLANLCAGLTPEKHEHALDVMASCQVGIVKE